MADELLPDVVMTDICMPYIDGLELIRRLRKVHPAMQFVIVSGYDDFSYAQQAVQLHVMDYLLKPLSRSGVEAVLQRVRARLMRKLCAGAMWKSFAPAQSATSSSFSAWR